MPHDVPLRYEDGESRPRHYEDEEGKERMPPPTCNESDPVECKQGDEDGRGERGAQEVHACR